MVHQKLLTVGAFVVGAALVGITSAYKAAPRANNSNLTEYYFEFTGTNGQEDQPAEWMEITQAEYLQLNCPGTLRGCALITSAVQGTTGNLYPDHVSVNTDPTNSANKQPLDDADNSFSNKTNSY